MNLRNARHALPAALFAGLCTLLSCDQREVPATASGAAVSLVPRLEMTDGDSVVVVDSVRIVLDLDGVSGHFFDKTVDFRRHGLPIANVPVGARWTLVAQGIHVSADSVHRSVWWAGSQSGTALSGAADVGWTRVLISLGDTASPSLSGSGLPAQSHVELPEGTLDDTLVLSFPSGDSLFVGGALQKAVSSSGGTSSYRVGFRIPATLRVKVVSSSGNVSVATYAFQAPSNTARDSTLQSLSTTPGTLQPDFLKSTLTYVDSVPFATSQVVVNAVASVPGDVSSILFNGSTNNVVPLRGDSDSILVEVVNLNGRSLVHTIRIHRSQTRPGTPRDSSLLSLSVDSGVLVPEFAASRLVYDDTVPTWAAVAVVRASARVPQDVALITYNGMPSDTVALRSADPTEVDVKVINLNGNNSITKLRIWHRPDLVAPTLEVSSPRDGMEVPYAVGLIEVRASAADSGGIDSIRIGDTLCRSASCTANVGLVLGTNAISVKAWDRSKNERTATIHVVRDNDVTPPTLIRATGASDRSVSYETKSATVSWRVTDDSRVGAVTINGGATTRVDDVFSATVPLDLGPNVIRIVALDSADNPSYDSVTITRENDMTPPTLTRGAGATSRSVPYDTSSATVRWKVTDNVRMGVVTIDGKQVVGSGDIYSATVDLRVGADTVRIVAKDSAGNSSYDSVTITRGGDVTPPTLTRGAGATSRSVPYDTSSATVRWKATDNVRMGVVTIDGKLAIGSGDIYSATVDLRVGADTVRIVAKDSAGNSSYDSVTITRGGDETPPTLTRGAGATSRSVPYDTSSATVRWKATDNVRMGVVTIDGKQVVGSGDVYSAMVDLRVGADTVRIVAKDSAGNSSYDSVVVTRKYIQLLDARDGTMYNAVRIGSQVWMAENLRYAGTTAFPVGACAGAEQTTVPGPASVCETYGRIYTWTELVGGTSGSDLSPSGIQGACPDGWHVPSAKEWNTLFSAVEADPRVGVGNANLALMATFGFENGNGNDLFGFRAIVAPNRNESLFFKWGKMPDFWTASSLDNLSASDVVFYPNFVRVESSYHRGVGLTVRCTQD